MPQRLLFNRSLPSEGDGYGEKGNITVPRPTQWTGPAERGGVRTGVEEVKRIVEKEGHGGVSDGFSQS